MNIVFILVGLFMAGMAAGFLMNSIAWAFLIIGIGILIIGMVDYLNHGSRL